MKVCISEFPDNAARQAVAWDALTGHVAVTQPERIRAARDAFLRLDFRRLHRRIGAVERGRLPARSHVPRTFACAWLGGRSPRGAASAAGPSKKWNVASEMGAVSSAFYVISANRRSYARDWFYGNRWLLSPEAEVWAETTAEQPFVTANTKLALAEKSKSTFPCDLPRMYDA